VAVAGNKPQTAAGVRVTGVRPSDSDPERGLYGLVTGALAAEAARGQIRGAFENESSTSNPQDA